MKMSWPLLVSILSIMPFSISSASDLSANSSRICKNQWIGAEPYTQGFSARIHTEGVKLNKANVILSCSRAKFHKGTIGKKDLYLGHEIVMKVSEGIILPTPIKNSAGHLSYNIYIPPIEKECTVSLYRNGVCSIGLDFEGISTDSGNKLSGELQFDQFNFLATHFTEKSEALGSRPSYEMSQDDIVYLNGCNLRLFADKNNISNCEMLTTSSGINAFDMYYPEAQNKLNKMVIRENKLNTAMSFTVSNESQILDEMKIYKSEFERYWRKARSGQDEELVPSITRTKGSHLGTNVGLLLGLLTPNPIVGAALGGVIGSLADQAPTVDVSFYSQTIKAPIFDLNDYIFGTRNLITSNDISVGAQVLKIYVGFLARMQPLSKAEVFELNSLKKTYSPSLDRAIDMITITDYQNQGSCVRNGDCHKYKL